MAELNEINKTELEKVSHEIMSFMRGKYALDEVGEDNKISFMHEQKIILSIYIYDDRYDFEIVFNKDEYTEKKFMYTVRNTEDFNAIKLLIESKFKPNRIPFSKENAVYGKCGHRCDLCIHYSDMDEEQRSKITENLTHVYDVNGWSMRCSGCGTPGCYVEDGECVQVKCAYEKNYKTCVECDRYPCSKATVGYQILVPKSITADDVKWGILPYVPHQYGN